MKERKDWPAIFHEAFQWPEHRVWCWKAIKGTELAPPLKKVLRRFAEPGRAHGISLSRDLVWAVSELSYKLDPLFLYEKVMSARMPFPLTVFDWVGEDRRLSYDEMGVRQEQHDTHPEFEVPAIVISEQDDGQKYIHFVSYDHLNRTLMWFPVNFHTLADHQEHRPGREMRDVLKVCGAEPIQMLDFMFTTAVVKQHPEVSKIMEDKRFVTYCTGPVFAMLMRGRDKKEAVRGLLSGVSGQFRWLGALLTLIDRPALVRYVDAALPDPVPKGERKPKEGDNRHQTLTLLLPKEKVVSRTLRDVEHERKKVGLHEVAGHWVYSHRRGRTGCSHVWPNQPTTRQECEACGALRWRRDAHQRGQGEVLNKKRRKATYSGISVEQLTKIIEKEGA